ncbi:hypothetical protein ARMGADRAFT_1026237 [Armillaria gallica]|uniref:Uncharacterized protein n=1 Tax=Armillaria gallica TaxID=47427 RepID=A0A2H3ECA9_ARMGA|nr:hypothetical protein ARMGADRAFT_1026237 [Armillaria gallica]
MSVWCHKHVMLGFNSESEMVAVIANRWMCADQGEGCCEEQDGGGPGRDVPEGCLAVVLPSVIEINILLFPYPPKPSENEEKERKDQKTSSSEDRDRSCQDKSFLTRIWQNYVLQKKLAALWAQPTYHWVWLQHDIMLLVQAQANCIQCKIKARIDVQKVYMPKTALLHAQDDDHHAVGKDIQPSKVPLYFPSMALRLNTIDLTMQKAIIDDEQRLPRGSQTVVPEHWVGGDRMLCRDYGSLLQTGNLQRVIVIWRGFGKLIFKADRKASRKHCKLSGASLGLEPSAGKKNLWIKRAEFRLLTGAKAYAFRQAALWSELHKDAEAKWLDIEATLELNSSQHDVATTDLDNRTTST